MDYIYPTYRMIAVSRRVVNAYGVRRCESCRRIEVTDTPPGRGIRSKEGGARATEISAASTITGPTLPTAPTGSPGIRRRLARTPSRARGRPISPRRTRALDGDHGA